MKSKLIFIEGKSIGIIGIGEVFTELFEAGKKPVEKLESDLLERLKEYNYIPPGKEQTYAQAFLEEYEKFYNGKKRGVEEKTKDLGTWRGIPREEVPWFPTIIEELCDGCKICLNFCSFGVYEYAEKTNKVIVANPFNCEVGCSMCALKCEPRAIIFPSLEILDSSRRQ